MNDLTPAQEEFNQLLANSSSTHNSTHPEDSRSRRSHSPSDLDEEDAFRAAQVEATMRHTPSNSVAMHLPPASFDANAATGVKGVIADARAYEAAKRSKFKSVMRTARQSFFGSDMAAAATPRSRSGSNSDASSVGLSGSDEESFLAQWRESRRKELETEGKAVRTRRTSPSVRVYGRFDEVDALGYLDAIEKVSRDTTVVVFVYDPECEVSSEVEQALVPLVAENPTTHFVKVHFEEVEFDAAAVPAVLAYRNQGDLVANLTGIIEMMPESDAFGSSELKRLLQQHGALA
ncbi:hypothetical protein TD95_001548 [Thielaviopsis punctulata]|uniref:Phosducin domain-containing protein n=1 Tax=Thielaviopsis punctulata TaxID=72032 RepID=A0A0F4ZD44_9PEZI|nr:hypothetical protein TD95_001548 [Thielaviopsis punctulata]